MTTTLSKNPFPIRFNEADIENAGALQEKLRKIPSLTQLLRAACSLGMRTMREMTMEDLLASIETSEIK